MKSGLTMISEVTVNDEFDLHLFVEDQDDWQVWLDTTGSELDGLCIGTGVNRTMAVENALISLAHLTANVLKLK